MALSPGTRLGPYEVAALIGVGGMGEVYRATDTNLNRQVAIKVLPASVAGDADRLSRFQREAEVLAALNHPHIAQIYGLEKSGGTIALVMELVEGETLADRIAGRSGGPEGPPLHHVRRGGSSDPPAGLPIDEALSIAKQIAEALEAAHEQGIIHRDLKPANIKVRPDGTVKVLDFGLAKALDPTVVGRDFSPTRTAGVGGAEAPPDVPPSQAPTITTPAMMTGAGMILGTAVYMSPEQARGKVVDKRADIWAFGCVLFEMLTGRRVFEEVEVGDTLAAVLKTDPDWAALPPDVPERIRLLLKRCLEKDRRARVSDISVARFLMAEMLDGPVSASTAPTSTSRYRPILDRGAGLVAGVVLTAGVVWGVGQLAPPEVPSPSRFLIAPPSGRILTDQDFERDIAISSDGTQIVYRAGRAVGADTQLFVRALDQLDARPITGTGNPRGPFLSPDGQWVGYFENGLKKIPVTGGQPMLLCEYAGAVRGASWGPDDVIVFATSDETTGLFSVPAVGGMPIELTRPAPGERDHLFPSVLPGARGVLFTIRGTDPGLGQIAVLDLRTRQWKTLVSDGSNAEYVETGHIVYVGGDSLRAVRFDLESLEVIGNPVPVVEQLNTSAAGVADFAVSRQGTLLYVPPNAVQDERTLVWVDRQGKEEFIKAPPRAYVYARLSPDGSRLALDARDQERDIWVWDLIRETLTRLTFNPGPDENPVWTPDSQRLVFDSIRGGGVRNLFVQAANGTGTAERLTTSTNNQFPDSVTPDGSSVLLDEIGPTTSNDVMMGSLLRPPIQRPSSSQSAPDVSPALTPVIRTPRSEARGIVSPDGRWLAYQSNESGRMEVYVRPFPDVEAGRWQISTAGGAKPFWARSGKELFYLDGANLLTTVPVETTDVFRAATPRRILSAPYFSTVPGRTYDVSADGNRFLMIKSADSSDQGSSSRTIVVVQNWQEELKRLVSTR